MICFNEMGFRDDGISLLYHDSNIMENIAFIESSKTVSKFAFDQELFINSLSYNGRMTCGMTAFKKYLENNLDVFKHGMISFIIDKTHPEINNRYHDVYGSIINLFLTPYKMGNYYMAPSIHEIHSIDNSVSIINTDLRSLLIIIKYITTRRKVIPAFTDVLLSALYNDSDDYFLKKFIYNAQNISNYADNTYRYDTEKSNSEDLQEVYKIAIGEEHSYFGETENFNFRVIPLIQNERTYMNEIKFIYDKLKLITNYLSKRIKFDEEDLNHIPGITMKLDIPLVIIPKIMESFERSRITTTSMKNINFYKTPEKDHNLVINGKYIVNDHYIAEGLAYFKTVSEDAFERSSLPNTELKTVFITQPLSAYISFINEYKSPVPGIKTKYIELADIANYIHNMLVIYNVNY